MLLCKKKDESLAVSLTERQKYVRQKLNGDQEGKFNETYEVALTEEQSKFKIYDKEEIRDTPKTQKKNETPGKNCIIIEVLKAVKRGLKNEIGNSLQELWLYVMYEVVKVTTKKQARRRS